MCAVPRGEELKEQQRAVFNVRSTASGILQVEGGGSGDLRLYDMQGRLVLTSQLRNTVERVTVKPGVYVWGIRTRAGIEMHGTVPVLE